MIDFKYLPVRNLIRKHVCQSLKGKTLVGNQVFDTLILKRQLSQTELPCINILTTNEKEDGLFTQSPKISRAQCDLQVYAIMPLPQAKELGDSLDFLCQQIHNNIDVYLGELVQSCLFSAFDMEVELDAQIPLVIGKLVYKVEYLLPAGSLNLILDDLPELKRIFNEWDMFEPSINPQQPGPDGQIDAVDYIEQA